MAAMANTGRSTIPDAFIRLAGGADLHEAVTWGLATRLCRKFSGCIAQTLAGSSLSRQDGRLVLTVSEPLRPLYTEAVEKDLRLLANWLDSQPAAELTREDAAAE